MSGFTVRAAQPAEVHSLSDLCRRSKAHWGYDADFMRLSEDSLAIATDAIAEERVLVVEKSGEIAGVADIAALPAQGRFDLVHFFVEPRFVRTGAGAILFEAITRLARARGASRLEILSDPNAVGFYERLGARRIGEAPSDAIPGRQLPLLEFSLD
jgi:GNAT superfamily N-acetyltransferase